MRGDSRGEGSRWGSRDFFFFLKKRELFFTFHFTFGLFAGVREKKIGRNIVLFQTKRLRLYLSTHPLLTLHA